MTVVGSGVQLWKLSMTEQAAALRRRDISAVELCESVLERVAACNPSLLAFCTLDADLVRAQASAADARLASGDEIGPLCGVPIGIKDLIFTRDLPTTGGSALYRDFVPDEDDIVVQRLRDAGAVILGKTNVPPFGFGPGARNAVFGNTRNPWNAKLTPGGSSGGSAAAVASGMGAAALGSDGGGSIRVPSSFCGVYGLKPSFGRVPLYPGCRDERFAGFSAWESLEHIGPITRTVADAATLLDVIGGPDSRDRHSVPREVTSFAADLVDPVDLSGLRVAWTLDLGGYARVDVHVGRAVASAARMFEELGAHVVDVNARPPLSGDPGGFFETFVAIDGGLAALAAAARKDPAAFEGRIMALIEHDWSFGDVQRAMTARQALYNQLWRFFEDVDLLLTPTTPVAAFDVERTLPERIAGDSHVASHALSWFTLPFNLTGNPAASLPCGWTPDGMPIGLQLIGNHLDDRTVLRASRAFEQAAPWASRWPEV